MNSPFKKIGQKVDALFENVRKRDALTTAYLERRKALSRQYGAPRGYTVETFTQRMVNEMFVTENGERILFAMMIDNRVVEWYETPLKELNDVT